jgi:hypothetical protein
VNFYYLRAKPVCSEAATKLRDRSDAGMLPVLSSVPELVSPWMAAHIRQRPRFCASAFP